MNKELKELHPRRVFKYFEEISKIPRASGNEILVSNYLVEFAQKHSLEVIRDESMNVIIKKPATKGYEKSRAVILQAHMDMVCDKFKNSNHDFSSDPIELKVDGDFLMADGTTLGADNGIAIAYYLTILSSTDYFHPPLEVLITTGEEDGMKGSRRVEPCNLTGKLLINMDTWIDNTLIVGCAGAARNKIIFPINWEQCGRGLLSFQIKISGLMGGHSGTDIQRGRANSNKLMGRLLKGLSEKMNINISKISGGSKLNAIARETEVTVLIEASKRDVLFKELDNWNHIFRKELIYADKDVKITAEEIESKTNKMLSKDTTNKLISLIILMPQGIQSIRENLNNQVESSCNIGIITSNEKEVIISSSVRSTQKSLKYFILSQINEMADLVNGKFILENDYPEWEYNKQSYLTDLCIETYKIMYGRKPKIAIVHSGLECGILGEKLGYMDMISFGPKMLDVHTPAERLSISSTGKTFQYLIEILRRIKY
ncbi:MAG: aminoacyl-histidine dipeptidase [Bacillota bacterium]|nr:aminoacyl-histidine dipeptidase [Bacillota bacterium]